MFVLVFCIVALISLGIVTVWKKRTEINWIEITIEQHLHEKGFVLIDIINPGLDRGPFPALTIQESFQIGSAPKKDFYRIVKFRDEEDEILEYWVKISKSGALEWRIPLD